MNIDLEKIDMIRERLNVTYRQAKEALEKADGDVVEAMILIEDSFDDNWMDRMQKRGEEVVGQIKTYVDKGNITKIKFKQGEKTLFEVPATLGAVGLLGALASTQLAIVAGIGTVAAMANKVTLELDKRKPQEETDFEEMGIEKATEEDRYEQH